MNLIFPLYVIALRGQSKPTLVYQIVTRRDRDGNKLYTKITLLNYLLRHMGFIARKNDVVKQNSVTLNHVLYCRTALNVCYLRTNLNTKNTSTTRTIDSSSIDLENNESEYKMNTCLNQYKMKRCVILHLLYMPFTCIHSPDTKHTQVLIQHAISVELFDHTMI